MLLPGPRHSALLVFIPFQRNVLKTKIGEQACRDQSCFFLTYFFLFSLWWFILYHDPWTVSRNMMSTLADVVRNNFDTERIGFARWPGRCWPSDFESCNSSYSCTMGSLVCVRGLVHQVWELLKMLLGYSCTEVGGWDVVRSELTFCQAWYSGRAPLHGQPLLPGRGRNVLKTILRRVQLDYPACQVPCWWSHSPIKRCIFMRFQVRVTNVG